MDLDSENDEKSLPDLPGIRVDQVRSDEDFCFVKTYNLFFQNETILKFTLQLMVYETI